MSYDIQIWSVSRPDLAASLPNASQWQQHDAEWSLERRTWQIVCGSADRVLPEDIPEAVSQSLPGISFVTELVLEPIGAPDSAKKELFRAANGIAKACHGIVLDRQIDELITPRGVKRFAPQARPERFSLLEMGWWFLGENLFTREGLDSLLETFSTLLPEALPKRYGLYEPPQFLYAETGLEHLSEFLLENLGTLTVLYPNRPVMGLSFACTKDREDRRLGFRCNKLSMSCEASVVDQPGWREGLRRFWLAVCDNLSPFYAEVRTLNGYVRMGATYGSDMKTDVHPIRSWFWRGIPRELGHAVAIGAPYTQLWPQAAQEGTPHGECVILDAGEWVEGNNLAVPAPDGIRQAWTPEYVNVHGGKSINWVTEYPQIWPFEKK